MCDALEQDTNDSYTLLDRMDLEYCPEVASLFRYVRDTEYEAHAIEFVRYLVSFVKGVHENVCS